MAVAEYEDLEEIDDDLEEDVSSPSMKQLMSMPLSNFDAKERYVCSGIFITINSINFAN